MGPPPGLSELVVSPKLARLTTCGRVQRTVVNEDVRSANLAEDRKEHRRAARQLPTPLPMPSTAATAFWSVVLNEHISMHFRQPCCARHFVPTATGRREETSFGGAVASRE